MSNNIDADLKMILTCALVVFTLRQYSAVSAISLNSTTTRFVQVIIFGYLWLVVVLFNYTVKALMKIVLRLYVHFWQQTTTVVNPVRIENSTTENVEWTTHKRPCTPAEVQQARCMNGGECFTMDMYFGQRTAACVLVYNTFYCPAVIVVQLLVLLCWFIGLFLGVKVDGPVRGVKRDRLTYDVCDNLS